MLTGLSAFPITPADAAGRVDTEALGRLLSRLVAAGVDSIGLLGSTGAYPFFTRSERGRAVAAAAECVGGRVPLLVGVGALRTDDALELARDAQAAGASAGLLAPVSYTPLLPAEVLQHFRAVAEAGLPLCIYNNPGTTHFDIGPELVGHLAALPGVVAVKTGAPTPEGAADAVAALRAEVPPGFSVGFSVDWQAPFAVLAGGDAFYSVLAGIYPRTMAALTKAARDGDAAETRRRFDALAPLWDLCRRFSSFRLVHLAAERAGIPARPPRPILPLDGADAAEASAVLERLALD